MNTNFLQKVSANWDDGEFKFGGTDAQSQT